MIVKDKVVWVTIEFENSDFVSLTTDSIISVFFERIADNILYRHDEIMKFSSCDRCELILWRKGLGNTCFEQSAEEVLSSFNNIVNVQLEYQYGQKTDIYIPWDNTNDETNSYQKVEVTDDRITITIQKP